MRRQRLYIVALDVGRKCFGCVLAVQIDVVIGELLGAYRTLGSDIADAIERKFEVLQ